MTDDPHTILTRAAESRAGSSRTWQRAQRRIGQQMRELRETAGISLRQLADKLDCSAPHLSDLEKGRRNWSDQWINEYQKECQK